MLDNATRYPFLFSDEEWQRIQEVLPRGGKGPQRADDRRVLSAIWYVLTNKLNWRDCPESFGPYSTIYNRFNRWCASGHWQKIYVALTGLSEANLNHASGCLGGKRRKRHPRRLAHHRRPAAARQEA